MSCSKPHSGIQLLFAPVNKLFLPREIHAGNHTVYFSAVDQIGDPVILTFVCRYCFHTDNLNPTVCLMQIALQSVSFFLRSCQYKYLTTVLMKIMEYHLQQRLILHLLDPLSVCDLCSFDERHISRKQKIQLLQFFFHTVKLCRSHQGIHRNNIYCVKFFCLHIFCNDLHRIFCRTVIKLYVQYVHFFIHLPHPFHFLGFCGQAIISNIQCFFNKRCKIFTFFKICNIIVNSQSHSSWIFLK